MLNVLFLCTGNSARSIFAASLINRLGRGKFRGYSAGSHPKGAVNPFTIFELQQESYQTDGVHGKDWADYEDPGAPRMDFVFTVGENAAAEVCPVWPGHPMTAHCGVADLADVERDALAKKAAFHRAFAELQNRISKFVRLRFESLDRFKLQKKLDEIGQTSPADSRDPAA